MRTLSSANLWKFIGIAAVLCTVMLLAGFGYAVKDMLYPKSEPYSGSEDLPALPAGGNLSESKEINITAIGDSLTKGTGDSSGEGYVKQVIALLKTKYPDTAVRLINNLAVNGMKADQLAKLLETDKGYRYALRQANLIVFTIGGNDLFQIAAGASPSRMTGVLKLDKLQAELPQGLMRLDAITKRLNAINPNAHVRLCRLVQSVLRYRGLPRRLPANPRRMERAGVRRCFAGYPNMSMAPTFDLFENTISRYLSSRPFSSEPCRLRAEWRANRAIA